MANRRCIYTGNEIDSSDPMLSESIEHIIPLSLGGSNKFVTCDVSRGANNRAGNEIDDAVTSLISVAMLRNKFKLAGHRGKIPNVRFDGFLSDIDAHPEASMIVDSDASVKFEIKGSQTQSQQTVQISGTEGWVEKMLTHKLRQAKHHGNYLSTPFGDIRSEGDIRASVNLAPRESSSEFKFDLVVDLRAHQRALQHFVVKVALCIGHLILGPEWTFGPDGIMLRDALFPRGGEFFSKVRGTLYAEVEGPIKGMLDLAANRHSIAMFRFGNTAVVYIAMFGGDLGVAAVCLSGSAKRYRKGRDRVEPEGHLFQLSDLGSGTPLFVKRSLGEMMRTAYPFFHI